VPFGADAGLLEHVGNTPAIVFGAGDIRMAHRPNESVDIDALTTMARSIAVTVLRFCGGRDPA
jgi:acetylornithine deacetylase